MPHSMKNYYEFLGLKNENVSKAEIQKALKKKQDELGGVKIGEKNLKMLRKISNTLLNDYERGKYDAKYMNNDELSGMVIPSYLNHDFSSLNQLFSSMDFNLRQNPFERDNVLSNNNNMTIKSYTHHTSRTPEGGYVVYTRETSSENGKIDKDIKKKITYDKNKKKLNQNIIKDDNKNNNRKLIRK